MKLKTFLVCGLAALTLAACSKVPAGNVGVKVYLLGTSKGVDSEELGPGRYWIGWNEELYLFPTFTQTDVWAGEQAIRFQTMEGLPVTTDVGISYHVDATKVNTLFQKFRKGTEEISDLYMRNMVRDAFVKLASKRRVESVYGEGKSDLVDSVKLEVSRQLEPYGIIVESVYLAGEMVLPDVVVQALNAKISATQKAQQRENEIQQTKAEAQKAIEEARGLAESVKLKAQAEADAINIRGEALRKNPEVIRLNTVEKWDGVLPRIMGGQGAIPFLDVNEEYTAGPNKTDLRVPTEE